MSPKFRSRPDGSAYPLSGGGKGTAALVTGGLALALVSGGGGGSAVLGGAGSTAMSAAESAIVRNVSSNLSKARQDIRRGNVNQAWQRLGLRMGRGTVRDAAECATLTYGQVRDLLLERPCRGINRVQFPVSYDDGTVSVLVSRVHMRSALDARRFRGVIDRHGSGDIYPLLPEPPFTGYHYDSDLDRNAVLVAEAEPMVGNIPAPVLDSVAQAATGLAKLAT